MNWLIYISGWFWGYLILHININGRDLLRTSPKCFIDILWTMTWVWICWKFID